MQLLNPMQWTFRFRTIATLLTWAVLPLGAGVFVSMRTIETFAAQVGLTPEQLELLEMTLARNLLMLTIPLLVICFLAAFIFAWAVVQPLFRLRKAMDLIARGDLSQGSIPVNSRDEVGQITGSFNEMVTALKNMVQQVAHTASDLDGAGRRLASVAGKTATATDATSHHIEQVRSVAAGQVQHAIEGSTATANLWQAAEQVASSADAQAHEVERVATTVQQVAAAIEQVADGAGVVAEAAARTRSAADDGKHAVVAVVKGMDRVRERVLAAGVQVETLTDSLAQVDEILQLITEIAEQTDLLALNAAIEAARVGEHGKGFAVVAGEVRRLAERSRKAASDIASRVENIRTETRDVVVTMEAGTAEVQAGTRLAEVAGTSLEGILRAVAETQKQVESISAAAEEISAAVAHVVGATHHLSAIAEENAATASQMLTGTRSVTELVAEVERGAHSNQDGSGEMAAAVKTVQSAVEETVACSAQVAATSTKLREHVSRFRLS